ncbi:MAG: hypothetical protein F6K21_39635 [Symploca sp. SIO2D2]|nr:hypothetical protein [Symploca sp. SIO2D2]
MKNFWINLPQSAKAFLILFLLGLSIIGVIDLGQLTVNQPIKPSPTTGYYKVSFIILSDVDDEPISKAEVQFIFDGAPAPRYTNDDGYVSISIPKRDYIDFVIRKKGFQNLSRRINLKADLDETLIYPLKTTALPSPTPEPVTTSSLFPKTEPPEKLPETSQEVESILKNIAASVQNWKNRNGQYPDDIGTNEINLGTPPGVPGDRIDYWPDDIPSNIDYDHWPLENGFCYVHVASLGKNGKRDYPLSQEVTQPGTIRAIGDDIVLGIDVYKCD